MSFSLGNCNARPIKPGNQVCVEFTHAIPHRPVQGEVTVRNKVNNVMRGERWWPVPIIGFLGGTAAMFALTEATRLAQLMAPIDNLGLLQLDLIQASVWGIFSAAIYAVTKGKTSNGRLVHLYVWMTIVSLFFLLVGLMLVSRLNGSVRREGLLAVAPLLVLGPLSSALSIAWSRGFAAVSGRIENA